MADLKSLTVRALRELARKHLGAGYSKLKTKSELVAALGRALPRTMREVLEPSGQAAKAPAAGKAAAQPKTAASRAKPAPAAEKGAAATEPDPEGFMVSRVAGEAAAHRAAIPLVEEKVSPQNAPRPRLDFDEHLGELPESYGDDAVVVLAKDPRTLYLYWDFSRDTVQRAFEWMPGLHTRLRVFSDGQLVREVEFSLESRSWYFHDLPPGRAYRVELVSLASDGQVRRIGPSSLEVRLPFEGPSSVVEDRFARIPFDAPSGRLPEAVKAAAPAPPFPAETREALYLASGGEGRPIGSSEQAQRAGLEGGGPGGARPGAPRPWSGTTPWRSGSGK